MNINDYVIKILSNRSSMYGASLVASEFDDSSIIIWGPRGCTSQVIEAMNVQRQQFDYYHFPVNEADILTNGISTLKKNIVPMVQGYINKGPMFLFLGDSTQLVSENVEGLLDGNVSHEFPLVFVSTGFQDNEYDGINETLFSIVKRFCKEKTKKSGNLMINVIPDVGLSPHWKGDVEEIVRILNRLGIQVNVFPKRMEIKHLRQLPNADATLLLNPSIGMKAAKYLESNFGVNVIVPSCIPIGIDGTKKWLNWLQGELEIEQEIIDKLIQDEEEKFFVSMRPGLREENYNLRVNQIKEKKFLVCDEDFKAAQLCRFLVKEIGFSSGYVYSTINTEKHNILVDIEKVKHLKETKELLEVLKEEDVVVILASDWIRELTDKELQIIHTGGPTVKKITLVSRPFWGFQGALYLLEEILNCIAY